MLGNYEREDKGNNSVDKISGISNCLEEIIMGHSGYIQNSVLCTLFKVSYAFDFKFQSF